MIFLSHNHADKPIVEPIALRLKEIFGQDKVFYDSWSIQPGDGIIEKMNAGLTAPEFVFFFVSEKSLKSNMVKLEWQNALFKSTQGNCKIIPIRIDGSSMPSILLQNLYIDLYSNGIEASIVQIMNVAQGNSTFTPQHFGFSNLTYNVTGDASKSVDIKISVSHLMEPNPDFIIITTNTEEEIEILLNGGQPHRGGFNPNVTLNDGTVANVIAVAPLGGAITPNISMTINVKSKSGKFINIINVMHKISETSYSSIPKK